MTILELFYIVYYIKNRFNQRGKDLVFKRGWRVFPGRSSYFFGVDAPLYFHFCPTFWCEKGLFLNTLSDFRRVFGASRAY